MSTTSRSTKSTSTSSAKSTAAKSTRASKSAAATLQEGKSVKRTAKQEATPRAPSVVDIEALRKTRLEKLPVGYITLSVAREILGLARDNRVRYFCTRIEADGNPTLPCYTYEGYSGIFLNEAEVKALAKKLKDGPLPRNQRPKDAPKLKAKERAIPLEIEGASKPAAKSAGKSPKAKAAA